MQEIHSFRVAIMNHDSSKVSARISCQTGKPKNNNTIAFCVDENYLPYALFVAEQFINLHPELPCDICICLPDISKVPEKFINTDIRFIELSIHGIEFFPVGSLSIAAYYRLFLPSLFEGTYEYIIYLDADVYINKPFYSDLIYFINNIKENFCVAAAADELEISYSKHFKGKEKLCESYVSPYHKFDHIYCNTGVLVFNTKNYNKDKILSKVLKYSFEHHDELTFHDQTALNSILLNNIALIPFSFNWQIRKYTYNLVNEMNPYIIHFIGGSKPWNTNTIYTKPYKDIYINFLSKNFPDMVIDISTLSEKRRKTIQHNNPLKEFIARETYFIRNYLENKFLKVSVPQKDNIKLVLTNPPFSL